MDRLNIVNDVAMQQAILEGYAWDNGDLAENTHKHMYRWFDNADYVSMLETINSDSNVDVAGFIAKAQRLITDGLEVNTIFTNQQTVGYSTNSVKTSKP